MPTTQVQFRRGNTAQNLAFTGAVGEVTVDTTLFTMRVHDGVTPGGFETSTVNSVQTLSNKTLTSPNIQTPSITSPTFLGNITWSGNIINGGATSFISTAGNITGSNVIASANLVGATASVTNVVTTTVSATTVSATGNITGGNLITNGILSTTGNIGANNITVSNVLTVNTSNAASGIINGAGNGQGNIGNSTGYFNTLYAKATSAQYSDLAEKYTSDAKYPAGTVVSFDGDKEVTQTIIDMDTKVAGVVSTNPSFIMNSTLDDEYTVMVALTGRVPTKVIGPVEKGDLMVSAGDGRARSEAAPKPGTIIGKSLENFNGTIGVIEVVIGRF